MLGNVRQFLLKKFYRFWYASGPEGKNKYIVSLIIVGVLHGFASNTVQIGDNGSVKGKREKFKNTSWPSRRSSSSSRSLRVYQPSSLATTSARYALRSH